MKLFLSHLTAYRFWSNYAARQTNGQFVAHWDPLTIGPYARISILQDTTAKTGFIKDINLEKLGIPLDSLDLLVTDPANRGTAKNIVNHLDSDFKNVYGSCVELAPAVYIATPELCFLQMAVTFNKVDLVEFGYELCGGYSLSQRAERGFVNRIPLTSVQKIGAYLKRYEPSRAVNRAASALKYISNHSASPRETTFTMLETLSSREGGYGFNLPSMNYKIELEKEDRWKRHAYFCDLYWPEFNLAVEYSGSLVHGKRTLFSDNERENIIELGGIRVIRIDAEQLSNYDSLEIVSKRIAQYMGIRFKNPSAQLKQKREKLRAYLFGRSRGLR